MRWVLPMLLATQITVYVNEVVPLHLIDARPTVPEMVVQEALRQDVPRPLVFYVAWRESRFRPWRRHLNLDGSVDRGVMQLNSYAVLIQHPFNARENIQVGTTLLAQYYRVCKEDLACTLEAYATGHVPKGQKMIKLDHKDMLLLIEWGEEIDPLDITPKEVALLSKLKAIHNRMEQAYHRMLRGEPTPHLPPNKLNFGGIQTFVGSGKEESERSQIQTPAH